MKCVERRQEARDNQRQEARGLASCLLSTEGMRLRAVETQAFKRRQEARGLLRVSREERLQLRIYLPTVRKGLGFRVQGLRGGSSRGGSAKLRCRPAPWCSIWGLGFGVWGLRIED